MAQRRIDALYCTQATANERIDDLIQKVMQKQENAGSTVQAAVEKRINALNDRLQELMTSIEEIGSQKIAALEAQREAITNGTCEPAVTEDGELMVDGDGNQIYMMDSDEVITFKVGEEDFEDKIVSFGNVGDASSYASNSYATGPALGIMKENRPSFFWVVAQDRLGGRRTEGGDSVEVKLNPEEAFQDLNVDDLKDGRYRVSFVPLQAGEHEMEVCIEGEPIRGSTFRMVVRAPTEYSEIGAEGADKGTMGEVGNACKADSIGAFHHPFGVCFNATGDYIFLVDQSNHRIQIIESATRAVKGEFGKKGTGLKHFNSPSHVYMDRENRLYVSDVLNHRIMTYQFFPKTLSLKFICQIGKKGSNEGQLNYPRGITVDEEKSLLLVCDSGNHRMQVFDTKEENFGTLVREFGKKGAGEGHFNNPLDVAVDCDGYWLVADRQHRIQIFDENAAFIDQFGQKGSRTGCINYPVSICVNDENAVYVCDQANSRVQIFDFKEDETLRTARHKWGGKLVATTPAEGEEPAGEGEEPAAQEWVGLKAPAGVAVNAEGMVVITDFASNRIYVY